MPEVLAWQHTDREHAIQRVIQTLDAGQIVALPAETSVVLTAKCQSPQAVEQLVRVSEATGRPLAIAVRGAVDALVWAPDMGKFAQRLARRCWPGPVTMIAAGGVERGAASQLPDAVRNLVVTDDGIRLSCPAHAAILLAIEMLREPLLLAPVPATAEQLAQSDTTSLVLDDGPPAADLPPTVLSVAGNQWQVLQEGIVPLDTLARLTHKIVAFICTGNTCRSPMAEALCKKLLAERLGCSIAELPERGWLVVSAGVAAATGFPASEEAITVAAELGANLSEHCSRRLTVDVLEQADHLFGMTASHISMLAPFCTDPNRQPMLLSPSGDDIADPVGGAVEAYRECAAQIARCLEARLPELEVE